MVYDPEGGWVGCEVVGGERPVPVYGASLACQRPGSGSDDAVVFSGIFVGGLSDDGVIADQIMAWELDVANRQVSGGSISDRDDRSG